jgi:hypothetical protein
LASSIDPITALLFSKSAINWWRVSIRGIFGPEKTFVKSQIICDLTVGLAIGPIATPKMAGFRIARQKNRNCK